MHNLMDALKLLDSDCWRVVFRKLNADDLVSCRQVCKPFQHILDDCEFQVKWKFKLILPHLVSYLKSGSGHLSWKDLYTLRLVCQSWQQSVDKYAEDYEPLFLPIKMKDLPLVTCFKSLEEIEEFQEKFGESRNPFPARTVYICNPRLRRVSDADKFTQMLIHLDFVELFGRNIFKLELCIDQDDTRSPLPFCELIRKVTLHMPNLKTFVIGCDKSLKSNEREMATWMEANVLGELPKLKALKIRLDERIENYLLKKYGPQLTYFERTSPSSSYKGNLLEQSDHAQLFTRLETLVVDLVSPEARLGYLVFLRSPLKSLKLSVLPYPRFGLNEMGQDARLDKTCWNMDELLRNVKHLPLEYLEILLFSTSLNLTEAGLKLEDYINQSIRTLRIRFYDYYGEKNSFNFLESLTKLENLELQYPLGRERTLATTYSGALKLNEYLIGIEEMDMYQSNIWEKVPSLKTLTVEWVRKNCRGWEKKYVKAIYTREKYESFRIQTTPKWITSILNLMKKNVSFPDFWVDRVDRVEEKEKDGVKFDMN